MKGKRQRRILSKREVAQGWIEHAEAEYADTGNPVHVWNAIEEALVAGLPLPAWTRQYLLDVAGRIRALTREVPAKGTIARAVTQAVGFHGRGRGNSFRDAYRKGHESLVAWQVYECHTRNWWNQRHGSEPTHDWGTIFADAAHLHQHTCTVCTRRLSVTTVERYWRRWAKRVIPGHLLDNSESQKIDDILR